MSRLSVVNNQGEKIVIVGAGPAGLNAAVTLAEYGVSSILIDEHSAIGGVVNRGPLRGYEKADHLGDKVNSSIREAKVIYDKYKNYIELRLNAQVLGPLKGTEQLGILQDNSFYSIDYDYLLIATGCHEKTIAFPGWTLPGVMTIGGAQLQIKSGLVKPGQKVVLTGTGPLLPVAAAQMHLAGVNVIGVFEAGRRMALAWKSLGLLNNIPLLKEGLAYHKILKKSGIPFYYGWGLVEARGNDELEEVVVSPYDEKWTPLRTKQKVLKADSLGVSYGFSSRSQLSQTLSIEHKYDEFSGVCPEVDESGKTSKDKVYIAGDASGIYGAQVASEQGKLSAISILKEMHKIDDITEYSISTPVKSKLRAYKKFRESFHRFSKPGYGFLDLPNSDTVICRCENVTKVDLDNALDQGIKDIATLKMMTRVGMGDCQGKLCAAYCSDYMRYKLKTSDIGELRPRFPLAPLPFSAIIAYGEASKAKKKDVA